MTRLNYALLMGVSVAVLSVWFGWTSGNPHWLTLNPPLGFLFGFGWGLISWTMKNWLEKRSRR